MSRRRHRRAGSDDEVKLNVAAMLDMAFQLLTFFILTFRPLPVEKPFALNMPDAKPVVGPNKSHPVEIGDGRTHTDPIDGFRQLSVALYPDRTGNLGSVVIQAAPLPSAGTQEQMLGLLQQGLAKQFADPGNPFDRLVLQVGRDMRYEVLMRVVHVCSQLRFADGKPLKQLTFVELPTSLAN